MSTFNFTTFDPLFSGGLFLPSGQLIEASASNGTSTTSSNPTIDTGLGSGDVFDNRGHDFLDPDKIQGTADDFGKTISARTTDVILAQLVNVDPLGTNPNSLDILNNTHSILNNLSNPRFGANVIPSLNSNPINWKNPTALEIQLGTNLSSSNTIFGQPFVFGSPQAQAILNPGSFNTGSLNNGSLLNLINALQNNQPVYSVNGLNNNLYGSSSSGLGLSSYGNALLGNSTIGIPQTLNLTLNNPTFNLSLNPSFGNHFGMSNNMYLGINNNLMGWLQNANTLNLYSNTSSSNSTSNTPLPMSNNYSGYTNTPELIQIAFQI